MCIKINKIRAYMAMTGSTSHVSGTSRFMVNVLDKGIFAKKALGPFTAKSEPLKSSWTK